MIDLENVKKHFKGVESVDAILKERMKVFPLLSRSSIVDVNRRLYQWSRKVEGSTYERSGQYIPRNESRGGVTHQLMSTQEISSDDPHVTERNDVIDRILSELELEMSRQFSALGEAHFMEEMVNEGAIRLAMRKASLPQQMNCFVSPEAFDREFGRKENIAIRVDQQIVMPIRTPALGGETAILSPIGNFRIVQPIEAFELPLSVTSTTVEFLVIFYALPHVADPSKVTAIIGR